MKKKQSIQYDYFVHSISEDNWPSYKAVIPAFDNAVVYGDSLNELEEGILFTIESEIEELKRAKKNIPKPDRPSSFGGKVLIRISPFLHEKLALEAKASGESLNQYISKKLLQ